MIYENYTAKQKMKNLGFIGICIGAGIAIGVPIGDGIYNLVHTIMIFFK